MEAMRTGSRTPSCSCLSIRCEAGFQRWAHAVCIHLKFALSETCSSQISWLLLSECPDLGPVTSRVCHDPQRQEALSQARVLHAMPSLCPVGDGACEDAPCPGPSPQVCSRRDRFMIQNSTTHFFEHNFIRTDNQVSGSLMGLTRPSHGHPPAPCVRGRVCLASCYGRGW